ncbi:MAG: hemerythrin domain-containing protein [Saprospiraceae bacterium]
MTTPIKRNESLKPLSRDHHHGLLLCWKIRQGIKLKVEPERIKKYLYWFWVSYLKHHFEIEEQYVFPVLGNDNKLVKQALAEHRKLKRLFENHMESKKSISIIEEVLAKHIRFEERVLFNEIEKVASSEKLLQIEKDCSDNIFYENLSDAFWKYREVP